jgi:hypothetical protein
MLTSSITPCFRVHAPRCLCPCSSCRLAQEHENPVALQEALLEMESTSGPTYWTSSKIPASVHNNKIWRTIFWVRAKPTARQSLPAGSPYPQRSLGYECSRRSALRHDLEGSAGCHAPAGFSHAVGCVLQNFYVDIHAVSKVEGSGTKVVHDRAEVFDIKTEAMFRYLQVRACRGGACCMHARC